MDELKRDPNGLYQPGTDRWLMGYLSVTKVLPFHAANIPADSLRAAARRGSAVHEATFYLDSGSAEDEALEQSLASWEPVEIDEVRPYITAYQRFLEDKRPRYTAMEAVVRSNIFGYAGRFDRVGEYDGQAAIFDFKTGPIHATEALQMAAYMDAYSEERNGDWGDWSEMDGLGVWDCLRVSIHLTNQGNYSVCEWAKKDFANDFDVFLGFLDTYRWKQEHGMLESKTSSTAKARKAKSKEMEEEISVLDQPAIEAKLDLLEKLKAQKSGCEALEKALKHHFEGVERVQVGGWMIEGKEFERNYKPKPAQDARTIRGWTTTFNRTKG